MKMKILLPAVAAALVGAFLIGRLTGPEGGRDAAPSAGGAAEDIEFWTCSMHPQIRQPNPGKCPICAMDLVPVRRGAGGGLGPRQIALSGGAIALAGIRTAPVIRELPTAEVRMVGKIDYDETRLSDITARFPGRLDRLYVDYTGISVERGDHLVEIYSPELIVAQEELLQAVRTAKELTGSANAYVRERAERTVEAAREKLLLWNLTPEQVEAIERRGAPSDRLTIFAPTGGIVIRKEAVEGRYVETGAPIYTIADLSRVWVQFDAYESDLIWLHYGQEVEFRTEAYPGQEFTGQIAFIDPVLNPATRTVRVRANLDNEGGKLKPGMFVTGVVRSRVAADGKVMSADLAGKWICPMHPEIVRESKSECPLCGMNLVTSESLGYLPANPNEQDIPLVIPDTAPLRTGKRAVVYVAVEDQPGVFEGRVVELGPRAGNQYIVESGLSEGELVVTHGAFKIDSAVQIQAKPSMMNPEDGVGTADAPPKEPARARFEPPPAFQQSLREAVDAYVRVADGLSHDDFQAAQEALPRLQSAVAEIDMSLLKDAAHAAWMSDLKSIQKGLQGIESADGIEAARAALEPLSNGLIAAAGSFGLSGELPVYVYHCPMAIGGKGADWIQNKSGVENPYFGDRMFTCGEEKRVIAPRPSADGEDEKPAAGEETKPSTELQ